MFGVRLKVPALIIPRACLMAGVSTILAATVARKFSVAVTTDVKTIEVVDVRVRNTLATGVRDNEEGTMMVNA